jgi:tape measure domain-containing protein
MNQAMNMVLSSFEAIQGASSKAIDTGSIQAARAELNKAEASFNQIDDEIRKASEAQQKFNNDMQSGGNHAGSLLSKFKGLALTVGAAFSVKQIIGLSDEMTSVNARLDLMNDGLQTTKELQDMIYQSAQRSRAAYMDTAAVVSKLGILAGHSFANNEEMIAFAEQMNKQFKIGGASIQEQTAAMYQLTQAMASGRLQGDEFRSIMENAPLLAQSIAEYMGKSVGELRKMSSEGLITADVIKNAMFASAAETNAKFAELPMTFAQVATILKNTLLKTFDPVIQGIGRGAQWIYDNWSTLEPIFWGLAGAVSAYAAITAVSTAYTWLAVAANRALMIAMLSNPVMWVALAIGVLIGFIYKWVQAVGGIKVAWLTVMDAILTFTGDTKVMVLTHLQEMINGAIDKINGFIRVLNKLPGVNIDVIERVSFATNAMMENTAAKYARKQEINMAKREAAVKGSDAGFDWNSLLSGVDNTASNTAKMADSMAITEENLEYLRDLAEQEAVNRFTTAEIKLEMTNNNQINSDMDLDGVVNYLEEKLYETMVVAAEGVHS